ncbi:MAG: hypothetical protein ACK418_23390 [Pseudomonas sp.]|uniref:hypothetical protein n=1 Tax=Pseudomonas sp. TaxID=306 RepID=UPI00391C7569
MSEAFAEEKEEFIHRPRQDALTHKDRFISSDRNMPKSSATEALDLHSPRLAQVFSEAISLKDFPNFTDEEMRNHYINETPIAGADTAELYMLMVSLYYRDPKGKDLESILKRLANIRDRDFDGIKAEHDRFLALRKQATKRAGRADKLPVTSSKAFMGKTQQLRFGKVVGDKLGVDPVLGSLLSPTGGMVGPGDARVPGKNDRVGWHGVYHDAGGYLRKYHDIGPGYTYREGYQGEESLNPLKGQDNLRTFWLKIKE